jgi:hypothetical protein
MQDKITHLGPARMVLRLRALVLALGETAAPPWWRTEYLSGAGLRILERIYPRTAFAAALYATGAAARTIHDASTRRGSIYHLFCLPIPREREIHTLLSATHNARLSEELRPALGNRDELMDQFRALASEQRRISTILRLTWSKIYYPFVKSSHNDRCGRCVADLLFTPHWAC